MTNNQLTENSVTQLLNNVRLARDNAERDDNRVDHSFYYALARALEELQERRKAVIDSEPVRNPVLAYADSYRDMAKQGVESVPIWSVITDLERNIAPLYRHAQQPVVQPMMFIDGDISSEDADKLAKVIRKFNEEDERPLAKMARIIRENPHPTNECDMPKAQPAPVVPDDVLNALQKVARIRLDLNDFDGDCRGITDCLSDAEEALIEVVNRRAAMLNQK